MLERMQEWWRKRSLTEAELRAARAEILQQAPAPTIWLFGKSGSGKTSVVNYLTGADRGEIGNGFAPQTRRSALYEFPSAEHPVMRFLDTRGLGETQYDPGEDVREFASTAHLMLVTVRALDHAVGPVIEPLRAIRAAAPSRPVLLTLTCLHEAYPQRQHPDPDPFDAGGDTEQIPEPLRRSLDHHQEQFAGLVDAVVPIDLTPPSEGFTQPQFGGERLKRELLHQLPGAYRQTVAQFEAAMASLGDLNERRALPLIMGYSTLAAGAAATPVPWVDIPAVVALQAHLIHKLAELYGQRLDSPAIARATGALGARVVGRMVLREALKFIPVVGMAANAAYAGLCVFATGKAACWYFGQVRAGNAPGEAEVQQMWREELGRAAQLWSVSPAGEANR